MTRFKSIAAAMLVAVTALACKSVPVEPAAQSPVMARQDPTATREKHQRPHPHAGQSRIRLSQRLQLTAEQKERMKQIHAELDRKNRPLLEQFQAIVGTPEATYGRLRPLREEIRANRRDAHMKLMGVLTPEQKEALEELRAERYRRWRERGAAHRPQEEHKPTKKEHRARRAR